MLIAFFTLAYVFETASKYTAFADEPAHDHFAAALDDAWRDDRPLSGAALLEILSLDDELCALFDVPAGIWEKAGTVTIREHTENVLSVFEKYHIEASLAGGNGAVSLAHEKLIKLVLALHDIGKHLPPGYAVPCPQGKEKEAQHLRTLLILERIEKSLPLDDRELQLMRFLVGNDAFGTFFKGAFGRKPPTFLEDCLEGDVGADGNRLVTKIELEERRLAGALNLQEYQRVISDWVGFVSAQRKLAPEIRANAREVCSSLRNSASELHVSVQDLFKLQLLYFQCDIRAYTADALSATPSLDYLFKRDPGTMTFKDPLFVFNRQEGRFEFSSPYEEVYQILKSELTESD